MRDLSLVRNGWVAARLEPFLPCMFAFENFNFCDDSVQIVEHMQLFHLTSAMEPTWDSTSSTTSLTQRMELP